LDPAARLAKGKVSIGSVNWSEDLATRAFVFRTSALAEISLLMHSGGCLICSLIVRRKVVILVGGNDVLALVSSRVRRILRVWKRFPCEPSPEWYRENVRAIARRLKNQTPATIGLCSLCPIGEDPDSAHPFQR
jgi:hypothetical protein